MLFSLVLFGFNATRDTIYRVYIYIYIGEFRKSVDLVLEKVELNKV
jgi:hypothetical protein